MGVDARQRNGVSETREKKREGERKAMTTRCGRLICFGAGLPEGKERVKVKQSDMPRLRTFSSERWLLLPRQIRGSERWARRRKESGGVCWAKHTSEIDTYRFTHIHTYSQTQHYGVFASSRPTLTLRCEAPAHLDSVTHPPSTSPTHGPSPASG